MKKSVLQITGSFHQGGSERQALQLAKLLREDDSFNVYLAALTSEGVLKSEAERAGFTNIPEFRLSSFYDLNFLKQLKRCARFIKENQIAIVHTHDFYTNIFGILAARYASVPLKIASKRETSGMKSRTQERIERNIFKIADAIVVNSKAVETYLTNAGVTAKKIKVVYNGLDLERLEPKETNRRRICEELNLPTDENLKFITLVANLRHSIKNQPMFLRAAKTVAGKFPEACFVLAGEGELKSDLETLAREMKIFDKTHFIGRCAKVPELLSISYAGALTSFAEGFSNSILEYMAARLPVVATNVGGAGEAIIENETGFIVESDDDQTMAKRFIELLESPQKAEAMGAAGRKTVEEKFSCATQLRRTLELYESRFNS